MMELSEASTHLAPDSPPPVEDLPRAKPHLNSEEKAQVVALMREFPNLDQLMAETIVLTNPLYDEVIEMENRAIKKMKAEAQKSKPEKEFVERCVTVE